jgi:hypothetical protein
MSGLATAGEWLDVRLTWLLGDANLLGDPRDEFPGPGIGPDSGRPAFFDNYDTRYTGFETLGHLVLHKSAPAFFEGFGADAALFLSLAVDGENAVAFRDEGSYIRMTWDWTHGAEPGTGVELTLFPLSADRMRMGYSYKASWFGTDVFARRPGDRRLAPGARLQVNLPWGYAFLGAKAARLTENLLGSEDTAAVVNWGGLAGLGLDLEGFVAEIKGAYTERGTFAAQGVRGLGMYLSGLSYQVGYHRGAPIGSSIDFELYRNDPYLEQRFFAPEAYDGGLSFVVKHEGSFLFQNLIDPDTYGQRENQWGWAFDLNAALKWGFWRFHLDAVARSLAFMLHEVPGFTPYQGFPDLAEVRPEVWAALGADYHFEGPRLTPGLKVGLLKPATYRITDPSADGAVFLGTRVVVVTGPSVRAILPVEHEASLVWTLKASLRWDYADFLGLVAELIYAHDPNQVRYVSDPWGLNLWSERLSPHVLGLNLMAQARY